MITDRPPVTKRTTRLDEAYAGIDVAFAKRKRLPVVVCVRRGGVLDPLPLRTALVRPPAGEGNARILQGSTADAFAEQTVQYLRAIESGYRIRIRRIAIDAPSAPRRAGSPRRLAEAALDRRRISCITTPTEAEFASIRERGLAHLAQGGPEANLPGANQLWMLIGFALFRALGAQWECLEVFPQAIASVLGVAGVHKSRAHGLEAQLRSAARHTGWPRELQADEGAPAAKRLASIGFGSNHDRLDAYLSAWIASLDEAAREPFGEPPDDVIWVPRVAATG